jgi:hypothetical protein
MSGRRLELLQWFGLFGGAAAWATHLVFGFEVTEASCTAGLGPFRSGATLTVATVVAAIVVLLAEGAAVTAFHELAGVDKDAPGPDGRRRFLVVGAMVANALFFVAVVLAGVATVAQPGCRGG